MLGTTPAARNPHGGVLRLTHSGCMRSAPACSFSSQVRLPMNASGFASISSSLFMAVLTGSPSALVAQEVVEVTGRDRPIDADFEELYRVGVLERLLFLHA